MSDMRLRDIATALRGAADRERAVADRTATAWTETDETDGGEARDEANVAWGAKTAAEAAAKRAEARATDAEERADQAAHPEEDATTRLPRPSDTAHTLAGAEDALRQATNRANAADAASDTAKAKASEAADAENAAEAEVARLRAAE